MARSRVLPGPGAIRLPLVGLILAIFARTFLLQGLAVSSVSMAPTLVPGDHVLIDRVSMRLPNRPGLPSRRLRRGDVIVFQSPQDARTLLLKRCAGVAGDRVETADGRTLTVPDKHYWMLGDNGDRSLDSRTFGSVSERSVVGRVVLVYWSRTPETRAQTEWDRTLKFID